MARVALIFSTITAICLIYLILSQNSDFSKILLSFVLLVILAANAACNCLAHFEINSIYSIHLVFSLLSILLSSLLHIIIF